VRSHKEGKGGESSSENSGPEQKDTEADSIIKNLQENNDQNAYEKEYGLVKEKENLSEVQSEA